MDREDKRIIFTMATFLSVYSAFFLVIGILLAMKGDFSLLKAIGIVVAILSLIFGPWWISGKIFR